MTASRTSLLLIVLSGACGGKAVIDGSPNEPGEVRALLTTPNQHLMVREQRAAVCLSISIDKTNGISAFDITVPAQWEATYVMAVPLRSGCFDWNMPPDGSIFTQDARGSVTWDCIDSGCELDVDVTMTFGDWLNQAVTMSDTVDVGAF